MAVEKGDVVEIKLVGRVKDGEVFEKTAEKPAVVIVGKKRLIQGLEEALLGMNEGDKKTVEIPPEKAYGPRNPELVKIIPMSAFKKSGINPAPGVVVTIDGYPARVLSVSGGRVRVDFNHELAGKTLVFDVEVVKVHKDDEAKVKALIEKWFDKGIETKVGKAVDITATEEAYLDREYMDKKVKAITELMTLGKEVHWTEIYKPDKGQ